MKFSAKASGDFEVVPAGNHVGICNALIDLGIQPGSGQYPAPKHQIYVRFELPTERIKYVKDGKDVEGPMSMGRSFTASMSEKANLRKFLESWFGKKFQTDDAASDFDVKQILGRKCLLNVTHAEKGGKTYANISNATPIPKGMSADYTQHNKSLYFSLVSSDDATYNSLPEWLRKKIDSRITEEKMVADYVAGKHDERNPPPIDDGEFDREIPF